jgi:hypothetical protein
MKASEIKKCTMCGKGVMHTGLPLFWRVTIERFGISLDAVQRRHGLEQYFGGGYVGATLAGVMGPDEQIAQPVMLPVTLILCEECAMQDVPIAALPEYVEANPKIL